MVFTYDQLKLINRVFPLNFIEDEFRLEGNLTKERIYKRLNSLNDNDLKNTYYLIHVKYRNDFVDEENKYLCLCYTTLKQIAEERNINLRKYLDGIKLARRTVDIYFLAGCVACGLIFKKILVIHILFALLGMFMLFKWDDISLFIARKLNKKVIHVQQYAELPRMMTITAFIAIILSLRSYDSVLYLVCAYLFLLFCHYKSYKYLENDLIPEVESLVKVILIRVYEVVMALLILWGLYNPMLDFFGEHFNTKSIKYIEGICSEVEDMPFDYKRATIDGNKVTISTLHHDVKVGDFYRIEYGVHTKAVTYVGRKDIVSQFKDKESEEITQVQDYLIEFEKNKAEEEKLNSKNKKTKETNKKTEEETENKEVKDEASEE